MTAPAFIENRTYAEIAVGDSASLTRTLTAQDIELVRLVTDPDYAETDTSHHIVAHGMWGSGLISAVLGTELPGPGTIYLEQSLRFSRPVAPGDAITASVTVVEKHAADGRLRLDCRCTNQHGQDVIVGQAVVTAPTDKVRRARTALPEVRLVRHERHHALLAAAGSGPPITTAIVHPCDPAAIEAAREAADAGLIVPLLVGPGTRICDAAQAAGIDIRDFRILDAPHSHAAAEQAVALAAKGDAGLLMKGSLHTDELISAVVAASGGLRTDRRISHVYVMDVPDYPRPLMITDAAINIAPTLEEKADIVRNAIELAPLLGIAHPRVAILAAVETVNPRMRATLDAAALCKMAERGQIVGGTLDGPLALDNAISPAAARNKGIVSTVAGAADILVVPDLEAGNMIAKQLTFLADADAAGIVLGARTPIVLTSRADSVRTRLASCALGVLKARAQAARR